MKNNAILFLKGFIIGVAKIIPGVSGAVLAISFNLYEKGITSIRFYFKNIRDNTIFLFIIGFGILSAIILTSKIVLYFLNHYYLVTMLFFVGLIIGGIPNIMTKIKIKNKTNIVLITISFLLVTIIPLFGYNNKIMTFNYSLESFIILILIGLIDALTMVVPGISGTAIMMIIGCYETIIMVLSDLTNINYLISNLYILIPFGIGLLIGVISFIFIMNYLFCYFHDYTYAVIIGFSIASIFLLMFKTFNGQYNMYDIVIGLFLLVLGYRVVSKLE